MFIKSISNCFQGQKPGIAVIVASVDHQAAQYVVEIRVQDSDQNEEFIQDIKNVVKILLKKFNKTNNKPQTLVMFRDGVSEGQFTTVMVRELMAIRAACEELQESYEPQITYFVVQKRQDLLDEAIIAQQIKAQLDKLQEEQAMLKDQLSAAKVTGAAPPPSASTAAVTAAQLDLSDNCPNQLLDNPTVTLKCQRLLVATLQDSCITNLYATLLEEFVTIPAQTELPATRKEDIQNARQHMQIRIATIIAMVNLMMKHSLSDYYLRHILGTFIPLNSSMSKHHQLAIEAAFIPTMKVLFRACMAEIDMEYVGMFFVYLAREDMLQSCNPIKKNTNIKDNRSTTVQDSLTMDVCNEILSSPDSFQTKVLIKILASMALTHSNYIQLNVVKVLAELLLQNVKETSFVR